MTGELVTVLERPRKGKVTLPPEIGESLAVGLYRRMVQASALDRLALELQARGTLSFYVSGAGAEARAVGAAGALRAGDWLFPSFRDLGAVLALGVPPEQVIAHWLGTSDDPALGRTLPFQYSSRSQRIVPPSAATAARVVQAAGAAHAMKLAGEQQVVLAVCGDAALLSGDFHAGLAFAGRFSAPLVVVAECRDDAPGNASVAAAHGVAAARVDGGDALAVYLAVATAVARARAGSGSTLIDAVLPRASAGRDPLGRLRGYLEACGLWSAALEAECRAAIAAELREALTRAQAAPRPTLAECFRDVSREPSARQQEQLRLAQDAASASDSNDP